MMFVLKGLAAIGTAAGLYKFGGWLWDGPPRFDQRTSNFQNGLGFVRDDEASLKQAKVAVPDDIKPGNLHKVRSRARR